MSQLKRASWAAKRKTGNNQHLTRGSTSLCHTGEVGRRKKKPPLQQSRSPPVAGRPLEHSPLPLLSIIAFMFARPSCRPALLLGRPLRPNLAVALPVSPGLPRTGHSPQRSAKDAAASAAVCRLLVLLRTLRGERQLSKLCMYPKPKLPSQTLCCQDTIIRGTLSQLCG